MDHLQKKFAEINIPGENVSVDEAMIKFQGRSSLKQYMPMKPTKRGIKVWVLADEYAFFSRLEIYTGKKDDVEHSLGARVVKNLTRDAGIMFFLIVFLCLGNYSVISNPVAFMVAELPVNIEGGFL